MGRSSDEKGADKAVAIRRGQQKERTRLQAEIAAEQKTISQVSEERAPIAAEVRKVEAEVGPIKYIAAFIYGVEPDATMLEKAVTWIIITIVVVFDPLAVIMLLAAQMTFAWRRGEETDAEAHARIERELEETKQDLGIVDPEPSQNLLSRFKEKIKNRFHKDDTPDFEGVRMPNGEWVQTGPAFNTPAESTHTPDYEPDDGPLSDDQIRQINELAQGYADQAREEEINSESEIASPTAPDLDASDERPGDYITPAQPTQPEAVPGLNRGVMFSQPIQPDNTVALGKASNSDFGSNFPANSEKGDVYLRTDYLPNRLFKFNGKKWIEVDKNQTDVYAYEEEYIKHLISEIDSGRYDPDALTDVERDQIQKYLTKNV
jgi:hypothetical protein